MLNMHLVGGGFGKKKDHTFFNFTKRAIVADLAVIFVNFYAKTRFFFNFAQGGFFFVFTLFHVPFWKAPIFTVMVFNQ